MNRLLLQDFADFQRRLERRLQHPTDAERDRREAAHEARCEADDLKRESNNGQRHNDQSQKGDVA